MKTMRKLSFLLAVAMVLSLFPVMAVNAAEPGYVFDFYYESDFDELYPASNLYCCDVTWEDNALKLVAENVDELGDPYFYLNSIGSENMEASDYPYFSIFTISPFQIQPFSLYHLIERCTPSFRSTSG